MADLRAAGPHADGLPGAVARFAGLRTILLATDYDGVAAPIVSDPAAAYPLPGTIEALAAAASLPGVSVALISGRDRATLARLSGAPETIVTVGSHGAEWDSGLEGVFDAAAAERRTRVLAELDAIAARYPGAAVEAKPLGGALHVRNVADGADAAARALDDARRGPAANPGVHATEGKQVLELTVAEASKGRALTVLRERNDADGVLYLGDDVTDEKAFAVLTEPDDISIKVGDGDTLAAYRVDGPADARAVFETIVALRTGASV